MKQARKLLRDIVTKHWMTDRATFTPAIEEAVEIRDFRHALSFHHLHKHRPLELVIVFGNDREEVSLPLGADASF